MRSFAITLLISLLGASALCQTIDSIQVFNVENNFSVWIGGTKAHTGIYISNVEHDVIDQEIDIDLFFTECAGFAALTPYDTLINLGILTPQEYMVQCSSWNDINLDLENCTIHSEVSIIDSTTYYFVPTGILNHELENQSVNVYPNPFDNFINVDGSALDEADFIVISDLNGRIVKTLNIMTSAITIELDGLQKGVYTLRVMTSDSCLSRFKIVKLK